MNGMSISLTRDALEARCVRLFGKKHWKKKLAEATGRDFSTIWRWVREDRTPSWVVTLLDAAESKKKFERITTTLAKQLR